LTDLTHERHKINEWIEEWEDCSKRRGENVDAFHEMRDLTVADAVATLPQNVLHQEAYTSNISEDRHKRGWTLE
jgi:hypothetical protein